MEGIGGGALFDLHTLAKEQNVAKQLRILKRQTTAAIIRKWIQSLLPWQKVLLTRL